MEFVFLFGMLSFHAIQTCHKKPSRCDFDMRN